MAEVAYIALGSNLGDRERFIRKAVDRLRSAEGVLGVILSALHETAPVGGPAGQG
ncbi:MAG TPA: 2-amino-4-hydroxy-6-hydroxymethyldihydropteridine diphosphokinase, partial [Phycisphaerae bacterium]|nr:2-amino-4-hydroxy-6-hydroxymethyldihydropteridine diphosphokinase [Phycisphaerae bacterium]